MAKLDKDYIYKRRLLSVADLLDQIKPSLFDYGAWVGEDWKGRADLSCGTTACALGHATTIPALRKAGLRLVKMGGTFATVCLKGDKAEDLSSYSSPRNAGRAVFGIDDYEFEYLFVPGDVNDRQCDRRKMFGKYALNYKATAKQVASHIRFFVKNKFK